MHALQSAARHHEVAIFADPMPLTGSLRMAQEMRPIETCHWLRSLSLSVSKQFLNVKQQAGEETSNRVGAEILSQFARNVVNKSVHQDASVVFLGRCSLQRGRSGAAIFKGLRKDIAYTYAPHSCCSRLVKKHKIRLIAFAIILK